VQAAGAALDGGDVPPPNGAQIVLGSRANNVTAAADWGTTMSPVCYLPLRVQVG